VDPAGAWALVAAALSWAVGSLYSRSARLPSSLLMATAMEMITGGALLVMAGSLFGEWKGLSLDLVSAKSWASLAYLAILGALVAFTAYAWLLKNTTPARAATYAFVNPVIALILGWALAGEPLSVRTLAAGALIVPAVALIVLRR
jgi:drug/metabolite transporter (DMT)-like permease